LDVDSDQSGFGSEASVGIESPDGKAGVKYSHNQAVLSNNMAIMFGSSLAEVESASVETDAGAVMYAQHRDYLVEARVIHPTSNDLITTVVVTLGNHADAVCVINNVDSYAFTLNDPEGYLTIDHERSRMWEDREGYLNLEFYISPTFNFPTSSYIDVSISARGVGVIPGSYEFEDALWVENKLDIKGSLALFSDVGFIQNGGWARGNDIIQFKGIVPVYPGTSITPRAGAISFIVTDELGVIFEQDYNGVECLVDIHTPGYFVRKTYNLTMGNVPEGTDLSGGATYFVSIDPFKPLPPEDVKVRADSYDDSNWLYDNDNEVYVTWNPAEDRESGILGYYVTTHDPLSEEAGGENFWIESPDVSTKLVFESTGAKKVWVWSLDKAGNPSTPVYGLIKVDDTEVAFSEFSPGNQMWINTHTPITSVLIDDGDGSGVAAKNVQYSTSITNRDEYTAWMPVRVARDALQVRASVQTNFESGKSNWIKYRATDVAGNGWTYSNDYNVWVDEDIPSFINFRPYETEFQNGKSVVVSVDITDTHGSREGSGIKVDTIEFRYSIGGKGLYGDWNSAEITTQTDQSVHIEMEMEFEEGKENYVQFRTYDNVGNYARSKDFNVKVNSAPEIMATVSDPLDGLHYITEERIYFDASESKDPDGDDLDFRWYSDINGLLSNSESFFRALSAGFHEITLIANDPAHTIVFKFDIEVLERAQIDPESIDTDGDGMYDQWEIKYKLNPFRSDGATDTDHDMFTNYQEFQNSTDPTLRSSHPDYNVPIDREVEKDKDTEDQYRVVTLGIVLISIVIILALILLAVSKRRNFQMEVDEEKDLEAEEMDYRQTLERKKSERLNMET
jgi:hypothetical protein